MVLEAIISPVTAEKKPIYIFFMGILYTTIAIVLSMWIFKEYASIISIFLIVIATIPLIYSTMKLEEIKDVLLEKEGQILKEHSKALTTLMFLFFGIVLTYTFWYVFLPENILTNLFGVQRETILSINAAANYDYIVFTKIFLNNIKVLTFCILFSLFYGAGSIFILTWNATIIATAMGTFIRERISTFAGELGFVTIANYFHVFSLSLLRYAIHGIPEILSYFIASLAGGILSVAIIKHDINTKRFDKILLDASNLILLSIVILLIAALLEVYVTPRFF